MPTLPKNLLSKNKHIKSFLNYKTRVTAGFTLIELLIVVAIIGINLLFAWLIKAPTLYGRKIMDEIEGLKMYLSIAEKDNQLKYSGSVITKDNILRDSLNYDGIRVITFRHATTREVPL